ncbi:MAG: DNA mismatch repair protein MutS, partial [Lacisediminimonas sp.]|nr:DNA mismatch repair protein MutS [Lacisediminimonas sp.]
MTAKFKDFSALKSLQKDLKAQQEADRKEQAQRREREAQAALEADLFRRSIGTVAPLHSHGKATLRPPL